MTQNQKIMLKMKGKLLINMSLVKRLNYVNDDNYVHMCVYGKRIWFKILGQRKKKDFTYKERPMKGLCT